MDDIDELKKMKRQLFLLAMMLRSLRFFVGAAATWLIMLGGYTGWPAFFGVVITGFAYGTASALMSINDVDGA